jgi:hypothetical protein
MKNLNSRQTSLICKNRKTIDVIVVEYLVFHKIEKTEPDRFAERIVGV